MRNLFYGTYIYSNIFVAMSENGKFAVLLNIRTQEVDNEKLGRGNLVRNFVIGFKTAIEYMEEVIGQNESYNPFSLIIGERRNNSWSAQYFSTADFLKPVELEHGVVHGFSNSSYYKPWRKVTEGCPRVLACFKQNQTCQEQLHRELMT